MLTMDAPSRARVTIMLFRTFSLFKSRTMFNLFFISVLFFCNLIVVLMLVLFLKEVKNENVWFGWFCFEKLQLRLVVDEFFYFIISF